MTTLLAKNIFNSAVIFLDLDNNRNINSIMFLKKDKKEEFAEFWYQQEIANNPETLEDNFLEDLNNFLKKKGY